MRESASALCVPHQAHHGLARAAAHLAQGYCKVRRAGEGAKANRRFGGKPFHLSPPIMRLAGSRHSKALRGQVKHVSHTLQLVRRSAAAWPFINSCLYGTSSTAGNDSFNSTRCSYAPRLEQQDNKEPSTLPPPQADLRTSHIELACVLSLLLCEAQSRRLPAYKRPHHRPCIRPSPTIGPVGPKARLMEQYEEK